MRMPIHLAPVLALSSRAGRAVAQTDSPPVTDAPVHERHVAAAKALWRSSCSSNLISCLITPAQPYRQRFCEAIKRVDTGKIMLEQTPPGYSLACHTRTTRYEPPTTQTIPRTSFCNPKPTHLWSFHRIRDQLNSFFHYSILSRLLSTEDLCL